MAIILGDNIQINTSKPVDNKYLEPINKRPYLDINEANSTIDVGLRYVGLKVNIAGVDHWYKDDINTLVPYVTGSTGAVVLNGIINPTTEGSDGDFYINTVTSTLFGPKTTGAWGVGVSLIGATGAQGIQGIPGNDGAQGAQGIQGIQGIAGADAPNNPETVVTPTANGNSHNITVSVTGYDNVVRADLIPNVDNMNYLILPDIVSSNYHVFAYLVQQGQNNTSLRITGQAGWVYVNNISSSVDINVTGFTLFGGSTPLKYRTHQILIYVHKVGTTTICEAKFISGNEY